MARDQKAKRVGIWIRVSTEDQVRGESPETHERRARSYAEAKRMVADIRSGHITSLILSKLARLARNTKELLEFAEIFPQQNADLISLAVEHGRRTRARTRRAALDGEHGVLR